MAESCCVCMRMRGRKGDGGSAAQGALREGALRWSDNSFIVQHWETRSDFDRCVWPNEVTWPRRFRNSNPQNVRPSHCVSSAFSYFSPSPLTVTSHSSARLHERAPVRVDAGCCVSTVTAEWTVGTGDQPEKKIVFMSDLCPNFPIFLFSQFHCCDSLSNFVFSFFLTFDTLWTISLGLVTVHQLRWGNFVLQSFLLLLYELLTFVFQSVMIQQHAHISEKNFKKHIGKSNIFTLSVMGHCPTQWSETQVNITSYECFICHQIKMKRQNPVERSLPTFKRWLSNPTLASNCCYEKEERCLACDF